MTTTNLTKLAQFALNQLLSGIELSEACENLSIYERLGGAEEHHFLAALETQSMKLGMVLNCEHLRPMTQFELFANSASSELVAYHSKYGVRLEDSEQSITLPLNDIPEAIINQRLPVAVVGLLAKVYFLAQEGV